MEIGNFENPIYKKIEDTPKEKIEQKEKKKIFDAGLKSVKEQIMKIKRIMPPKEREE